jgi:O-antigen/teichoic acid export membrane protein
MKSKFCIFGYSGSVQHYLSLKNFAAPVLFIFASGSNFFFQVLMARSLHPEEFGVFENYWSIMSNLALLFSGTQIFAAYSILINQSSLVSENEPRKYFDKYLRSTIAVGLLSTLILLGLLSLGSSRQLAIFPAAVIFLSVPVSILGNIMLGKVQGSSHPIELQVWSFLMSFSKVLIAVVLLQFTENILVLIIALVLKQAIFGLILAVRNRNLSEISVSFFSLKSLQINLHYVLFWLIAGFDVSIFGRTATDLELGNYAAAANIGKIVLFFAMMFPTLLFRFILTEKVISESQKRRTFAGFFLAVCLVFLVTVLIAIREWLFVFLYGANYLDAADIFIPYSLAMIPVSIYYYVLTFNFVELKTRTSILLLVVAVIQLLGMGFLDVNTVGFLSIIGFGSSASLLILKFAR